VTAAYDSMLLSNAPAAKILASNEFRCIACTDVTGFGLLGHLIEMIQYVNEDDEVEGKSTQQLAVDLFINKVPTLPGAVDCVKAGILSTLHPQVLKSQNFLGKHPYSFRAF
jgi:selenide,water dikinase